MRLYSPKETCDLKEPTDRSHLILSFSLIPVSETHLCVSHTHPWQSVHTHTLTSLALVSHLSLTYWAIFLEGGEDLAPLGERVDESTRGVIVLVLNASELRFGGACRVIGGRGRGKGINRSCSQC